MPDPNRFSIIVFTKRFKQVDTLEKIDDGALMSIEEYVKSPSRFFSAFTKRILGLARLGALLLRKCERDNASLTPSSSDRQLRDLRATVHLRVREAVLKERSENDDQEFHV